MSDLVTATMECDIDRSLPLLLLSTESRSLLKKLNFKRILTTDGPIKLLRDWRGVAYLLDISNDELIDGEDKIARVLEIWIQRNDGTSTLGTLLDYLGQMDRYDIYDDLVDLSGQGKLVGTRIPYVDSNDLARENGYDDDMIITYDDRKDGHPNYYHAYVLFAQQDWDFVRQLLGRMKAYNYKLCTEYDIVVGSTTQYAPVSRLIHERCALIILVYSPDFLTSRANKFYSDYAQAASIESNKRNIIPIIYRECELPHNHKYYHKLIYNNNKDEWVPYNFWEKLASTLGKVNLPTHKEVDTSVTDMSDTDDVLKINSIKTLKSSSSMLMLNGSVTPKVPLSQLTQYSTSISNLSQSSEIGKLKKKKKVLTRLKELIFPKTYH